VEWKLEVVGWGKEKRGGETHLFLALWIKETPTPAKSNYGKRKHHKDQANNPRNGNIEEVNSRLTSKSKGGRGE
jgi:hypothetical protein